jgi:hypothetical protein
VIFFSFHFLRRAPLHNTSILGIIIVHWDRRGMPVSVLLLLVVVIVIILRHWRRYVITMMVRVRRWWWISIIKVVGLRMMLLTMTLIHIRVLIRGCWGGILVILE